MPDKAESFLQLIRRDRRGRLKVYLGYAAGVGKTYLMLEEAHRLKSEGVDVMVGVVETHGRADTARLVGGLDRIPMRRVEYHGIPVEEMDLDAIIARHPQVVLVDELAHTNAPGSRNTKRYQDAEDILAAGINVIATLNVQHLESLYDMVERATNVKVRERIPDSVLAEADQIVNVDLSPEDLHKRLRAGKIYPAERIPLALENFFKSQHLEQLRELTLRETASQIDFRRRETAGEGNQASADQVMVCLAARGSENAALLRYGSRLAGRLNRNWYAVYVQTLAEDPTAIDAERQRFLHDTLTLANQLGATVFTLKGENIGDTLHRFAEEYRVGHVILGKPRLRPRWKSLLWGRDVVNRMLGLGGTYTLTLIDTHGTAPDRGEREPVPDARATTSAAQPNARPKLTEYLGPGQILVWEGAISKEQAMRELLGTLVAAQSKLDAESLFQRLMEREQQGSTFLNEGVALPHARIENLESPLVALGISHGGILDVATENPIEVVFLLLSPKDSNRSHLELLAVVGRMMLNRTLRKELGNEYQPGGIFKRLVDFDTQKL